MLKYKHNTFKRKIKVYTKAFYKNKWYRILRTIGRYFFPQHAGFDLSSTSTYTIMKVKKSGIPKKKSR